MRLVIEHKKHQPAPGVGLHPLLRVLHQARLLPTRAELPRADKQQLLQFNGPTEKPGSDIHVRLRYRRFQAGQPLLPARFSLSTADVRETDVVGRHLSIASDRQAATGLRLHVDAHPSSTGLLFQ